VISSWVGALFVDRGFLVAGVEFFNFLDMALLFLLLASFYDPRKTIAPFFAQIGCESFNALHRRNNGRAWVEPTVKQLAVRNQ
jgi:hypothetical protein